MNRDTRELLSTLGMIATAIVMLVVMLIVLEQCYGFVWSVLTGVVHLFVG